MATNNRKSFLTLNPVNFSLTEGTNIPPPVESPIKPATPVDSTPARNVADTVPQTPELGASEESKLSKERADSVRTPLSPVSSSRHASPRPGKPRKLFSLNNLRQSFSSSRTSLNAARPSIENGQTSSAKRPTSPSASFSTGPSVSRQSRPRNSPKKSGGWFKRKSGLFLLNGDNGLASVQEDQRPSTRESKRMRDLSPAPLLPEIESLSGGGLNGGEVGWDEKVFKR